MILKNNTVSHAFAFYFALNRKDLGNLFGIVGIIREGSPKKRRFLPIINQQCTNVNGVVYSFMYW